MRRPGKYNLSGSRRPQKSARRKIASCRPNRAAQRRRCCWPDISNAHDMPESGSRADFRVCDGTEDRARKSRVAPQQELPLLTGHGLWQNPRQLHGTCLISSLENMFYVDVTARIGVHKSLQGAHLNNVLKGLAKISKTRLKTASEDRLHLPTLYWASVVTAGRCLLARALHEQLLHHPLARATQLPCCEASATPVCVQLRTISYLQAILGRGGTPIRLSCDANNVGVMFSSAGSEHLEAASASKQSRRGWTLRLSSLLEIRCGEYDSQAPTCSGAILSQNLDPEGDPDLQ